MIKNYFKTAWRNLVRNKSYAAINIVGLAIGIAACLLIFVLVSFETSFDNFHPNKEKIYRVVSVAHSLEGVSIQGSVPLPTAEGLRMDFPELKQVATIFQDAGSHFTIGDDSQGRAAKIFKEDDAYLAEPQFFDIFKFGWLAGDKKTALIEPNSVVLTRDEADKFFGNWKDAMGKTIKLEKKASFKVTGILGNPPENTDFHLKVVMSYSSMKIKANDLEFDNLHDWVSIFGGHYVFIVLPNGLSVDRFNADLTAFVKKHKPADYAKDGMQLQALADMHYDTKVELFHNDGFSHQLIDIISLIGLFLLIIACVNFINLATAQAVNRSKEVGIRKVLGSNRKQLIMQFICETLIIALFAIIIAACISWFALPYLNKLLALHLNSSFLLTPSTILFIAGTLVGVTLLAGFYPAIVLSGFNPIAALKNKLSSGRSNGVSLRRALVVFQFCIAQVLVIGTLVIISQMDYFKNRSLGYAKDAVINVPFPNDSIGHTKMNTLRDELLQQPGVKDVSYSFASPTDNMGWNTDLKYNNSPKKTDFYVSLIWADANYFSLYKMKFIAGGPYVKSDTLTQYVVNETFLKKLGVHNPQDAIGKNINFWDDPKMKKTIVGVVKDFNTSSLKHGIPPLVLGSMSGNYQLINIKIQPTNVKQTLSSVEHLWTNAFPQDLYEYQFLDNKIASFYDSENQLSQLYKIFAGIAIFISCLGLYGLISFMAIQRTKEVGIRKTLGASVSSIVYLFSKEFTILIIVAFAISVPLGWYFMNKWLQNFTYQIHIGPGIFLLAISVSVIIAWLTVGYKAVKAALVNPVKSLRSE